MKDWDKADLSELLVLQRGFDITKAQQHLGIVPIVSSSGVSSYHNQAKCKAPGVVTGRKGTLGKVFFLNLDYWPHDTTLWVKDFKENCPKFCYYFLKLLKLETYDVGASNPTLNRNHIHKLKISKPKPPIQRKIAAILSAYDDLIENNNRRITILEKMAEELYREWFVRLRFPGHEKVKIVKGVPEGWEVKKVESAFNYLGGGTPSTTIESYWQNGSINWYSPTDLTASNAMFSFKSNQMITNLGLKESSAQLFPPFSIMMTSRATIGQISINTTQACTNQGFITCIPNANLPLHYLFYWLKLNKEYFIQMSNGSTFLELTKGRFKKIDIIVPQSSIMKQYVKYQEPVFKAVENLLRKNSYLKESRDRLLSRLMSGKLDISKLDIQFPPSMREDEKEPAYV